MRPVLLFMIAAALASTAWAEDQPTVREPVREGPIERLVLDDGAAVDAAVWRPAESAVTVSKEHVRHGDTALRFHIDVDWETGEPKYPIGWPRMNRTFPEAVQDFSAWDYLEFSVYSENSRDSLPKTPLGMTLYDAGGAKAYTRQLTELKLGQWVDYRIPVSSLDFTTCTGMQFYISESNYRDGDKLDFWVDDISLVRYVEPTITDTKLAEGAIMGDDRYVLLEAAVMGVKEGQAAEVQWELARDKTVAAKGSLSLPRGTRLYEVPLPATGLAAGEYELKLTCGDSSRALPLRVVASPWQEGSR